jgi:sugar phosphate permease
MTDRCNMKRPFNDFRAKAFVSVIIGYYQYYIIKKKCLSFQRINIPPCERIYFV